MPGVREEYPRMNDSRKRWERPDFQEHPLGAEVTAYLSAPARDPQL